MKHKVSVRCYETLGVPNTTATCSCGESKTYFPAAAQKEGFSSDFTATSAWAKAHENLNNLKEK